MAIVAILRATPVRNWRRRYAALRNGVVLIPSFAVGRAQLLQHMLVTLMDQGEIPEMPVYMDSPMTIDVSDIYCRYHSTD
jgi:metallo-beta-lactamase family protein